MKVKLVFSDWKKNGQSVYGEKAGIILSIGDLHSGSTFEATIDLPYEEELRIKQALKEGYYPEFYVSL